MAASTYRFFPWARRGLADKMTTEDTGAPLPARASVSVGLVVTGVAAPDYKLSVYGPGDVIGVDTTLIVRTDPRPNASDVEANFFPAVEFDASDFPWMFTPAKNETTNRLRPWCVLIVVDLDVVAAPAGQSGRPLPVITIPSDARATELPDLAESWAWAHAQMVTESTTPTDLLNQAIAATPAMNVSRIVAPRRLEPNKRYAACLVPAFDAGVTRGLGGAPTVTTLNPAWVAGQTGDVQLPVYFHWEFSTGPAGDFETLARRLKPALPPATAGIERMYVGGADPSLPKLDPAAANAYLDMDGPLRAPTRSNATIADVPQALQDGLAKVLNATSDQVQNAANAPASVLGPPIYGSWHANQHTVPAPGPGWLRELNLDPRTRAAAGLGSEIERRNQEDFMDWAWEQVGDVLKANALLSRSRLSMETLIRVHTRHVATLPPDRALQFSAPMLRRVPQAGTAVAGAAITVRSAIEHSSVPNSVVDPALRRLISPRSATVRAAARHAPPPPPGNTGIAGGILGTIGTLSGVATATLQAQPATAPTPAPAPAPTTMKPAAGVTKAASTLGVAHLSTFSAATAPATPTAAAASSTAINAAATSAAAPLSATAGMSAASAGIASAPTSFIGKLSTGQLNVELARFVPDGIAGMPDLSAVAAPAGAQVSLASVGLPLTVAAASFSGAQTAAKTIVAMARPVAPAAATIAAAIGTSATVTPVKVASVSTAAMSGLAAQSLRAAALPISKEPITKEPVTKDPITKPPITKDPVVKNPPADPVVTAPITAAPATAVAPTFVAFALSTARDSVVSRTNPRATVLARVQTMLNVGAAPLPLQSKNTGFVPPILTQSHSPIGVSGTFDRIMAAPDITVPVYRYLAELDPSRFMPGVGDVPNDSMMLLETNPRFVEALMVGLNYEMNRELLWREYPTDQRGTPFKHFWGRTGAARDIEPINTWATANALGANSLGGPGGQIVMLVRGRLLKRYPNTSIYAWRSVNGRLVNPPQTGDVKKPAFTGVLGTDIAFAGFELTDADLATGEGWFFVLQQQPTEPRFGFDEGTGAPQQTLNSWSDANWDDTGTAPGHYLQITGNRLSGKQIGDTKFVDHAAHLATITIHKPVAVALSSKTLTAPTTPK